MQSDDIDVLKHMRPKDVIVFQDAAKHFNVYIAVRRTNTASLKYIGVAGYVPKRLDCKPKTADQDGIVEGQLRELAGLVVDPTIVGEAAFKPGKYKKAVTEWEKFSHTLLGPPMLDVDGRPAYTYIPPGKFYAVQLDNSHKHYGCLMFSASSLITAGRYIQRRLRPLCHRPCERQDLERLRLGNAARPAAYARKGIVRRAALH